MLTTDECLQLLKKHGIDDAVLRHSLQVNKVAMLLGEKLRDAGETVDLELLNAASLLHDIGKNRGDERKMSHVLAGAMILEEEGFHALAEVVRKHSIYAMVEPAETPTTWEERILNYADRRVAGDRIVSVEERLADLQARRPGLEKSMPAITKGTKELEQGILKKIGLKSVL